MNNKYNDVNSKLKKYIIHNVFPLYSQNDTAHGLKHIEYVISRSLDFAATVPNINYDMVYTIAAYHDIGHHINPDKHEEFSANLLATDIGLIEFFAYEDITIMTEAVADHRASLKGVPRSIYGKIVSSADRNTSVDDSIKRSYAYRLCHMSNASDVEIIEACRQHLLEKFGKFGYARTKMYFDDPAYRKYIKEITALASDSVAFANRSQAVNSIKS